VAAFSYFTVPLTPSIEMRTHEALKYINEIAAILAPTTSDPSSAPTRDRERLQDLAPKEQWETFASEIQFPDWARTQRPPILWVGGKQNKRGACWVSSLALDLIEALEAERGIDLAYVLCDHGGEHEPLTPRAILNMAIVQLLKARPDIVFERQFMDLLPFQMLKEASHSTQVAYVALASLLKIVGLDDNREIFIVVDRIDMCTAMARESEAKRFLQSLQNLNEIIPQLRMIVTSSTPAPEMGPSKGSSQHFAEIWVNPHKPIAMSSR
jgi:hypothetical protein